MGNTLIRALSGLTGLLLLPWTGMAQLTVQSGLSPEEIVQDHLVGEGLRTKDIRYTGHPEALGVFEIEGDAVGFSRGVILSTGRASDAAGPNDNPKTSTPLGRGGDKKFYNIAKTRTFDAAILEFDLMAAKDSLVLNFIFASEEYNDYVGSTFSDAFVVRLSGPGYPNGKDLGVIPGTQTHISVNTVNYNTNGKYYRDNNPYTLAGRLNEKRQAQLNPEVLAGVEFDGMTRVMSVGAKVKPREKYHIEIGIADAGDGQMDSGLLIEAGSLNSVEQYRWVLRRQKIAEKRRQDSLARVAFVADSLAREQAIADSLAAIEQAIADSIAAARVSETVPTPDPESASEDVYTEESQEDYWESEAEYAETPDSEIIREEAVEPPPVRETTTVTVMEDPYTRPPSANDIDDYKAVLRYARDAYLLSDSDVELLQQIGAFALEHPEMHLGIYVPGTDEISQLRYDMVRLELLKTGLSPERIFKNPFSFLSAQESGGRHRAELRMRPVE
ncbi:MAG: choice-of-anchor L domain-containing protein [Bacteroidota bacterium]